MLIICPTPIGNLQDTSPRQRDALQNADIIACEDTRRTGKLLELLGIARTDQKPRLLSYHEHNADARLPALLTHLEAGHTIVMVSDAGTPTISDPGFRLVREAARAGHEISALPGPVAAMVALSGSGLPSDRFFFEGFLPTKRTARRTRLEILRPLGVTTILYESPRRTLDLLEDIQAIFGPDHQVCLARELTKLHEEYLRGTAKDLHSTLAARLEILGEIVLILAPHIPTDDTDDRDQQIDDKIRELLHEGMRPRGIKEVISALFDIRKSEIYDRIETIKSE